MSLTVVLIGLSLSMDAFAVSVGSGISFRDLKLFHALRGAFFFGLFQFIMPVAGWYLGKSIFSLIEGYDHWVAFALLTLIGGKMIKESFDIKLSPRKAAGGGEKTAADIRGLGTLFVLTVATSVDALAVGVSFSFLNVNIIPAALLIGVVTFGLSVSGVKAGNTFGMKYKSKAELAGGVILILMGLKIVLEHTVL
jgi:putative Mn2+ efflux pump MntP